jgi:transglutaminase-like putative cysteine protease
VTEGLGLTLCKSIIVAAAVVLYLLPLATPPGLIFGAAGTVAGYLLARAAAPRVRLAAGLFIAALLVGTGQLIGRWLLNSAPGGGTVSTLYLADAIFFGLASVGVFFAVRLLGERARVFSVLELGVVVGAVAHTFADHRHQRIHQPRFLSDWAWSNGIDPATVLSAAGVAALVLAALVLLRTRRAAKLLLTLLLLLLGGGLAFLLAGHARIDPKVDTNELGLAKGEDQSDSSSGGGSSGGKPPDPVAIALLHDDLPEDADVLYFRQSVRSRLAGDRLVEDNSGHFDQDIIASFPAGEPVRVASPEAPAFHRAMHTSMFLLVDHAQLPGLGQPTEMRPLENPDPRRFVAAYDVDSLLLNRPVGRLIGRTAMPAAWTEEQRRHYTELPADPRYRALSNQLIRDVDPRFVGDDVMKALAIKRYLEKAGFYSLKQKQLVGTDPVAQFLFGDLHGYCVHFSNAAVMLLRSQGIPARVALGYGVQTRRRGAGSSILILGNEAHAWPELYLDGVGWVTFDIYPEHSDEPPPPQIDQDLESTLGELARKDKTGGKAAKPGDGLVIPWGAIRGGLAGLLGGLLAAAYGVKIVRRLRGSSQRLIYRGVLDQLSDLGAPRRFGETRERHAARLLAVAPSFTSLTHAHLRAALGRGGAVGEMTALARATRDELRQNLTRWQRLRAALNPIGWYFTR